MKKISLKVIVPIAALIIVMNIYSCSENPVVPPVEPFELDSARFDWDIDTLSGWGFLRQCVYGLDTNNIFLINSFERYLLNIKNGKYYLYPVNGFGNHSIAGINDEVYIGGNIQSNSGKYVPHLKKWQNGIFEDIPIPECDTCGDDYIKYIYITHKRQIWMMTNYFFISYSNNNFNFYRIPYHDSSWLRGVRILEDHSNLLKAYAWDVRVEGKYQLEYSFIFGFENDNWEILWQNTWNPQSAEILSMDVLNNYIVASRLNKIYEFNGIVFNNILTLNISNLNMGPEILGNSYQDFLFRGNLANGMGNIVMHWDGNNLSHEFTLPINSFEDIFFKIDENTFWIISNLFLDNITLIFKGKKKN